jgi:hypothetical protein
VRSRALKVLIATVVVVALGSVAVGLASPDGSVGPDRTTASRAPSPSTSAATPAPAATPSDADQPGPDLAPAAVRGTWPGAPDDLVADDGTIDWCAGVSTSGAAEAEAVLGREAVDAAACAAVRFVFEHRYSRLSLPRRDYEAADLAPVLRALDERTRDAVYRPRVAQFVAAPASDTAGEQLGLVLFTARSTPDDARHAEAGPGLVFYGPAFSTRGYADRAAWINPTWSSVAIRLDRSTSTPRVEARLTASASMPVWSTATRRDAMLTVPTRATFTLTGGTGTGGTGTGGTNGTGADDWRVAGWTISRGDTSQAPLDVR